MAHYDADCARGVHLIIPVASDAASLPHTVPEKSNAGPFLRGT